MEKELEIFPERGKLKKEEVSLQELLQGMKDNSQLKIPKQYDNSRNRIVRTAPIQGKKKATNIRKAMAAGTAIVLSIGALVSYLAAYNKARADLLYASLSEYDSRVNCVVQDIGYGGYAALDKDGHKITDIPSSVWNTVDTSFSAVNGEIFNNRIQQNRGGR